MRVTKHLKPVFGMSKLVDITANTIELYLRRRLRQRIQIRTALGYREGNVLQAATVHQEFRVLRRILNVAVRKLLLANPCPGVEFPVRVKGLFDRTTCPGRNGNGSRPTTRHGRSQFGELEFPIFGSTTCAQRTRRD